MFNVSSSGFDQSGGSVWEFGCALFPIAQVRSKSIDSFKVVVADVLLDLCGVTHGFATDLQISRC